MRSIKVRLLVIFLSISVLAMLTVSAINLATFRPYFIRNTEDENMLKAKNAAGKVNEWLSNYGNIIDTMSKAITSSRADDDVKKSIVEYANSKNNDITDVYVGLENGKFIDGSGWVAPPDYNPTKRGWYQSAIAKDGVVFTEPYIDAITKKLIITVCEVLIDETGKKIGVVGGDILLDKVTENVNGIKTSKGGKTFLLDKSGTFLTHSDEKIRGTNIKDNSEIKEIALQIMSKDSGNVKYTQNGEKNIAFVETIKDTGWKLVITLPYREITSKTNSIILIAVLIILAAALIISVVVYILAGNISNPIIKLHQLAVHLANGDLRGNLNVAYKHKRNDEIGKLMEKLDETANNLGKMVKNIKNSAHIVAGAASEISAGNEDLSQRTQEQAASLEETSSAIEELTATVKQNADNANSADALSNRIIGMVEEGDQVLKQTINSMEDATSSSKKINEIISVVNEIAFQTNLLALNAAVEAARAGEQGRGFAVVASEVRNLAGRSAQAAKEIQVLIKASVDKIQNSNGLVLKTGKQLSEISDSIKSMGQLISEIAAASKEQSIGIEEVSKAITQMDQVTQQNASLVEEAAASSETMKNEAQELIALVGQFKINGEEIATHTNEHKGQKSGDKDENFQKKMVNKNQMSFSGFEKF